MKSKTASSLRIPLSGIGPGSVRVGRLLQGSVPGAFLVQVDGAPPAKVRTTLALDQAAIDETVQLRQEVVLALENDDPALAIAVGLVQLDEGTRRLRALAREPRQPPVQARVDGQRVVLEGKDEVTLKCGEASITLKRDGKILVKGAYVETQAKGVNRIKGGSVKIN